MATNYDFNITQGTEFYLRFKLKDSSGSAIDLTNYLISGKVKNRYGDSDPLYDLAPSGVTNLLTGGCVDVLLKGESTSTIPVGQHSYDIEIYTAQGYADKVVYGNFNVYPEITT